MTKEENLMKGSVHEDDFYIVHGDLVLMKLKKTINWIKQNFYLHKWLVPLNELQDGNPYAGCPVGNIPKFMPLDNYLNCEILHSLNMHSILSCCILYGKETYTEKRNMCFSSSTPR